MELLIKKIPYVVTLNKKNEVLSNVDIFIKDGVIEEIGENLNKKNAEIVDGKGKALYPGLINTHHHFYQTLTRNYSYVQNMELFDWLKTLYRLWRGIDENMVYNSSLLAMGELIKYGATTIQDHHYVFPKNSESLIDRQIEAAKKLGVRIHTSRGSMSKGESAGGLPPDSLVQTEAEILEDSERLIKKYHDGNKGSMCQVVLAPCSPFSVTNELLVETAKLARQYGVRLHTHLAETKDEEQFTLKNYNMRPLEYMESVNWIGEDVWYAHGIHFNDEELKLLAKTKTGVAHCPTSNMKLSSGIARISEMVDMGIPIGLGVDGSASNDCSNLLSEIRQTYLLQRLDRSRNSISAVDALKLGTIGGAKILGREDTGSIEIGKMGDCFLVDLDRLEFAGTLEDVASIPGICGINRQVDITIINGKVVFKDGILQNIDELEVVKKTNEMSESLKKLL